MPGNPADGRPTKEFFVKMLVRDISINDAILDLLDNCLDGVVRIKKEQIKKWDDLTYYQNYYAKISISDTSFVIEDNCGGISREIAEKYAFRMGRIPNLLDENESLPTVGVYGIGMKRAIFKIGNKAEISTQNKDDAFTVRIDPTWITDPDDWYLPIEDNPVTKPFDGTRIKVEMLNASITSKCHNDEALKTFTRELTKAIRESYSFILKKGFSIYINEDLIEPLPIELLVSTVTEQNPDGINPYLFKKEYDLVQVRLAVGLYSPLKTDEELEEEIELIRKSDYAGWTVICNDRVVLYNDKTHLTGWGEADVPKYHPQFISISGVVVFESIDPLTLPMTTTKRGIDLSSSIYADVKNKMREGLKLFTNYTNAWKGRLDDEQEYSSKTEKISFTDLLNDDDNIQNKYGLKTYNYNDASISKPSLPKPPKESNHKRILYSKPIDDIKKLEYYFYKDSASGVTASKIGEECFDRVLEEAKK